MCKNRQCTIVQLKNATFYGILTKIANPSSKEDWCLRSQSSKCHLYMGCQEELLYPWSEICIWSINWLPLNRFGNLYSPAQTSFLYYHNFLVFSKIHPDREWAFHKPTSWSNILSALICWSLPREKNCSVMTSFHRFSPLNVILYKHLPRRAWLHERIYFICIPLRKWEATFHNLEICFMFWCCPPD